MSGNNSEFPQLTPGGNPHDYFGRKTIGDPVIAADLLRNYADDPTIAEYVDLDHLQAEPTQFFGPTHPVTGPKEVILDVPYIAHLRDPDWKSEVLLVYEHKSSPNLFALLQLLVQAALSLYKRWTDAGRPSSRRNFRVPIPIMVLVYCGKEDLDEKNVWFQDIFGEDIPELLRQFVPQFRLIVINLRKFDYAHLPGKLETQAVAETMKRAVDGTLAEHFPGVVGRFSTIPLGDRITEILGTIAWYSDRMTDIKPEQISEAITSVIKGKEGVNMAEVIRKGIFQQGFETGVVEGRAEGVAKGKAEGVLIGKLLNTLEVRFNEVPKEIEAAVSKMTDPVALQSWVAFAKACQSLDEFANALK
jgi:hypothetical protein